MGCRGMWITTALIWGVNVKWFWGLLGFLGYEGVCAEGCVGDWTPVFTVVLGIVSNYAFGFSVCYEFTLRLLSDE